MRHLRPWVAILIALLLLLAAIVGWSVRPPPSGPGSAISPDVQSAAQAVVAALAARDGAGLARLVHPSRGVRFSPYAFVDVQADQVFTRADIAGFWQDRRTYRWGFADGSGDPIDLTPADYAARFIMDRDFTRPDSIGINTDQPRGNTVDNAAEVYPGATRVEYFLAPAPGTGDPAFDWAALRLIFEPHPGGWYLIGVIHDEWTT